MAPFGADIICVEYWLCGPSWYLLKGWNKVTVYVNYFRRLICHGVGRVTFIRTLTFRSYVQQLGLLSLYHLVEDYFCKYTFGQVMIHVNIYSRQGHIISNYNTTTIAIAGLTYWVYLTQCMQLGRSLKELLLHNLHHAKFDDIFKSILVQ